MGMFNNLICEYPLPKDAPPWARETDLFQTKSLEPNVMATVKITTDGQLVTVEDGVFESKIEIPPNYTGKVFFCDGYGDPNGNGWQFVDFCATFIDGDLNGIETVSGGI